MQILLVLVGLALVAVGLLFAITGLAGDSTEGEGRGLTLKAPAWLFLVVIGVLLMWFSGTRDWNAGDEEAGQPTTTAASQVTTNAPTTSAGPAPTSTDTPNTQPPGASTPDLGGCVVAIANPLASIRADTAQLSREIVRVPAGSYPVLEIRDVVFVSEDRWFLIDVDGEQGWIMDSTFNIDSKTARCNR